MYSMGISQRNQRIVWAHVTNEHRSFCSIEHDDHGSERKSTAHTRCATSGNRRHSHDCFADCYGNIT